MLDKKYDHLMVENNKYDVWKAEGYFTSNDFSKESFCIVIPPTQFHLSDCDFTSKKSPKQ